MRFLTVVTLAALLGNIAWLAQITPAFNPSLRDIDRSGSWQSAVPEANYDLSEYRLQRGFAALQALPELMATLDIDDFGEVEVEVERIIASLKDGLKADPANAYTWTTLAEVQLIANRPDAALQSARTSWAFAPYHAQLATGRISVSGEVLRREGEGAATLTSDDLDALRVDFETLSLHAPTIASNLLRIEKELVERLGIDVSDG